MSVRLANASSSRVEFGDVPAIAGATAISVAITLRFNTSPSGGRGFCGQWGLALDEKSWVMQCVDTDEVGFVICTNVGSLYGFKTTATNFASGSTYRVLCRLYDLSGSGGGDIWINGAQASITSWFAEAVAPVRDAYSTTFVGHEVSEGTGTENVDAGEFAMWSSKVPDGFCAKYGVGYTPAHWRYGGVLYAPMRDASPIRLVDRWGRALGANTGSLHAQHPFVIEPHAPRRRAYKAPAAAPMRLPRSLFIQEPSRHLACARD